MAYLLALVILSVLVSTAHAKDLGVHGHVFAIEEEDLLVRLKSKAASLTEAQVKTIQNEIRDQYLRLAREPKSVTLDEASEYCVHYFDPTVTVSKDIEDHEGNVIVAKGTTINPLSIAPLTSSLLFFDGSNPAHLRWAREESGNTTWILVKGRPIELEEQEGRPIYFDQYGVLTAKLLIKQVPARVVQEGNRLKIEETPLEDPCGDSWY